MNEMFQRKKNGFQV